MLCFTDTALMDIFVLFCRVLYHSDFRLKFYLVLKVPEFFLTRLTSSFSSFGEIEFKFQNPLLLLVELEDNGTWSARKVYDICTTV